MLRCSRISGSGITIHSFTLRETLIHLVLCLLYIILRYYTTLLLPAALQLPGKRSHPGRAVYPGPATLDSCISVRFCTRLFLTFRSLVRSEDEQSNGNVCPLAKIPWKSESALPQKRCQYLLSLLVLERMAPKKN